MEEEKIESIELVAERDIRKGEEVNIESIFSYGEQRKEFELCDDVSRWRTKLKVDISKVGALETTADITKRKGEKTCIRGLLSYPSRRVSITASEDVKRSEILSIKLEHIG